MRWGPESVATDAHVPGNVPVEAYDDGSWAEKAAPDVPGDWSVGVVLSRRVGDCWGCGLSHQRDPGEILRVKDSSIGASGLPLLAARVRSFVDVGSRVRRVRAEPGPKCMKNVRLEKRFALILGKLG